MAVSHTTALEYLGKYVSFQSDSSYLHVGVINSIIFTLDGKTEFLLVGMTSMIFQKSQN